MWTNASSVCLTARLRLLAIIYQDHSSVPATRVTLETEKLVQVSQWKLLFAKMGNLPSVSKGKKRTC